MGFLTQLPALAVANSSWFNTQAFFVYGCACQSLSALALAVLLHGRWQHGRGQHDPRLLRSERSCAHLGTEPAGSSGQCAEPCTQPAGHERAGDDGDPSSEQAADRAGHSRRHWQRRVPGRGRAPTPRGCMRLAIGPSRPPSFLLCAIQFSVPGLIPTLAGTHDKNPYTARAWGVCVRVRACVLTVLLLL